VQKPNKLLEFDVQQELDWDPELDDTRIVIAASDGKVTLTGAVPTYFDSVRAADDTFIVGGVRAVDNQLLVGPVGEMLTDDSVATACGAALDAEKRVPKGAVTPDVSDGWVTLRGQVRHHYQRLAAEHAVGRVDGVLGIDDDFTITGGPIPSDVADRIQKALQRNAVVDDSRIAVSNAGSTIYLDGTADSWMSRREAEDTAWNAPGVTDVIDRLEVAA
jgi:osmotically-inducible protein OsmY